MDKFINAGREKKCGIGNNRKGRISKINPISVLIFIFKIFDETLLLHNLLISIGNFF